MPTMPGRVVETRCSPGFVVNIREAADLIHKLKTSVEATAITRIFLAERVCFFRIYAVGLQPTCVSCR